MADTEISKVEASDAVVTSTETSAGAASIGLRAVGVKVTAPEMEAEARETVPKDVCVCAFAVSPASPSYERSRSAFYAW